MRPAGASNGAGFTPAAGDPGAGLTAAMEWIESHQAILWWFGSASIVVFFLGLLIVPIVVLRIPADYFDHPRRPASRWAGQHPVVRGMVRVVGNILGCAFLLAGLAMLLLPGQGLLTILIGFLVLDFPGKYRWEKWLLRRRLVLRPVNALRRRAGRAPLRVAG